MKTVHNESQLIISKSEKLNIFPLRHEVLGMSSLSLHSQNSIFRRQEKKRHHNRKQEFKMSRVADDMILHIEKSEDSTKTLLETINLVKLKGYKNHHTNVSKIS